LNLIADAGRHRGVLAEWPFPALHGLWGAISGPAEWNFGHPRVTDALKRQVDQGDERCARWWAPFQPSWPFLTLTDTAACLTAGIPISVSVAVLNVVAQRCTTSNGSPQLHSCSVLRCSTATLSHPRNGIGPTVRSGPVLIGPFEGSRLRGGSSLRTVRKGPPSARCEGDARAPSGFYDRYARRPTRFARSTFLLLG
jgi:hypothetical protein